MANISAFAQKLVLDWLLGGAAATQPGQRWIALSRGTPNSTNFTGSEPNGTNASGYSRQSGLFGAAASPAGSCSITAAVTFGPFLSSDAIQGAGIFDTGSVSSGNNVFFGTLLTARTVLSGDTIIFNAGALITTLS